MRLYFPIRQENPTEGRILFKYIKLYLTDGSLVWLFIAVVIHGVSFQDKKKQGHGVNH
jgi:hypothetical protein